MIPRAVALALAVASLVLPTRARGASGPDAAPAQSKQVRVLLLPIVVHSLGHGDYLQAGLGDMIAARLARDPHLDVVRIRDPKQATTDAEVARLAGVQAKTAFVLYGSFTHFGEGASLDLFCAPTEGKGNGPREVFIQSGNLADLIPKLGPLAGQIAGYVVEGKRPAPAVVSSGGSSGAASAGTADLERRVDALEKAVFGKAGASSPAAKNPLPAPGAKNPVSEPAEKGRDRLPTAGAFPGTHPGFPRSDGDDLRLR